MRSLPTVESADHVTWYVTAHITPLRPGPAWVYSHADIARLDGLGWEVDFGGGLGLPADYRLTLSSSLAQIMERKGDLPGAEVRLDVLANSERWYPHVGVVRGLEHDGDDPNRITLHVVDALLDDDPWLPVERLADSWSNVHPADFELGYPLYYGEHHRPFYFAAVTCDLSVLLGPRNISSENHVSSVWFNAQIENGIDPTAKHLLFLNKAWQQQSGSTNVACGGYPFEAYDAPDGDHPLWLFGASQAASVTGEYEGSHQGQRGSGYKRDLIVNKLGSVAASADLLSVTWETQLTLKFNLQVQQLTRVFLADRADLWRSQHLVRIGWRSHPNSLEVVSILNAPQQSLVGSLEIANNDPEAFTNSVNNTVLLVIGTGSEGSTGAFTFETSMQLYMSLASENYRRYSVFALPTNSADVAISKNPLGILDDVWSHHAGVPFRQGQSSDAQVDVQSHVVQAFFAEREPLFGRGGIADVLGHEAGVYLWIGDSGMLNFRAYTESADAAVDATIQTSHWLDFRLRENPLGITTYNAERASRFRVEYGYDYQRGAFQSALSVGPADNALCDSAEASGVRSQIVRQSRYILSADVASRYVGHLLRVHGQGQSYVEGELPAQFWGLELGDVIHGHHPIVPGSESLFQVVAVEPDFMGGTVRIRAAELRQADGS